MKHEQSLNYILRSTLTIQGLELMLFYLCYEKINVLQACFLSQQSIRQK